MKRFRESKGCRHRAAAVASAVFACIFAFAAAAGAAEKSTTEEILDILKEGDHISDARHEELTDRLESEKVPYDLEYGGRIMVDWAAISADDVLGDDIDGNGVEFRRTRIFVSGSFDNNIIFKAQYDFAGGDADFKDVFMGMKNVPGVGNIKIGHFKEPFSLEEQTSSKYITFMERALPNAFSPSRNTGVMVYDSAHDNRMSWAAGAFYDAGSYGEGFNDYSDVNFTGRITGAPVYEDNGAKAVHLGLSYTHQFRNENETTISYSARPEAHIIDSIADTGDIAADDADIINLEAAMVKGPFSVQGEYMQAFVDSGDDPDFSGYYVYGSYFLTGEKRNYSPGSGSFGRVRPNSDFSFQNGGTGALEIGLRYSSLDLTDEGIGDGELKDVTLGLNWHLNAYTRVMCNYVYADVDDHGTYDDSANILQARFQVDF